MKKIKVQKIHVKMHKETKQIVLLTTVIIFISIFIYIITEPNRNMPRTLLNNIESEN